MLKTIKRKGSVELAKALVAITISLGVGIFVVSEVEQNIEPAKTNITGTRIYDTGTSINNTFGTGYDGLELAAVLIIVIAAFAIINAIR